MASKTELVYSIRELLKEHTDDSLVSSRHILFMFNNLRAKFLRQLYSDRGKELDASAIQTLCLNMEPVSRATCGITIPCTILRSTVKLPDLLSLRSRSALVSAGPAIVGVDQFEEIDRRDADVCMGDSFATISFFQDDGYLYVIGNRPAAQLITCVRVKAVFSDPEALTEFQNCCNCTTETGGEPFCMTDDTEYPIPGHLIQLVSDEVLKLFLTTNQLDQSRDKDNDSVPSDKEGQRRRRR